MEEIFSSQHFCSFSPAVPIQIVSLTKKHKTYWGETCCANERLPYSILQMQCLVSSLEKVI